jgi:hypothetical protein
MTKMKLEEIAAKYKELALQMKELDKQAAPLKKQLTDYAKKLGLVDNLEIGGLTIERRVTEKATIDRTLITPDWLYRLQQAGSFDLIDVQAKGRFEAVPELLQEIDYKTTEVVAYAIRV